MGVAQISEERTGNTSHCGKKKKKRAEGTKARTVATSPKEVDSIIREVYGKIYKGNGQQREDPEAFADKYMKDYKEHIFHLAEMNMEDIN